MAFTYRTFWFTVIFLLALQLANFVSLRVYRLVADKTTVTIFGYDEDGDTGVLDASGRLFYVEGVLKGKPGSLTSVPSADLKLYDSDQVILKPPASFKRHQ